MEQTVKHKLRQTHHSRLGVVFMHYRLGRRLYVTQSACAVWNQVLRHTRRQRFSRVSPRRRRFYLLDWALFCEGMRFDWGSIGIWLSGSSQTSLRKHSSQSEARLSQVG